MIFSNLSEVIWTRSEYNMYLSTAAAMGMPQGPDIWLLGGSDRKKIKSEVAQPLQGGQDQFSVPQVCLKGSKAMGVS